MNATVGYLSILAALAGAIGITVRGFVAMRDPGRAHGGYWVRRLSRFWQEPSVQCSFSNWAF
jgi:hypothetical protein